MSSPLTPDGNATGDHVLEPSARRVKLEARMVVDKAGDDARSNCKNDNEDCRDKWSC